MNKYLKNFNRIEFVVTTACTGNCKHCSQGEHNKNLTLDAVKASEVVRKTAELYNIKSIMTFGGEALLCPDTVCEIHKAAREMKIPKRQLITNGYFTENTAEIKEAAKKIIESGVNEILISVDAFHQETIPLSFVKLFADAVNTSDINVLLNPAWLKNPDDNNIYNIKTKSILEEFRNSGINVCDGNVIFPEGNALKYFESYFNPNEKIINPYEENPYDIKAISIDADGSIFGSNIYRQDICDILASYNP